jgi:nitroimidazol reductase NimA-like FMN-containing flavoprotein (pyridoxamine 5'-phosphate oxidase superfamily)
VKRVPARAVYEREVIHAILDEGFIAHLGVVIDGAPRVIPFVYARIDDGLYLHGSTGNRVLRGLCDGEPGCLTVTHVDGLVLARSAFHNSVNYRSVVIHAAGEEVTDPTERMRALRATVEHVIPGRWEDVRAPNEEELRRTMVVRMPLDEASAKLRRGEPVEEPEDLAMTCWAGVVPVKLCFGVPEGDSLLPEATRVPDYLLGYDRPPA